MSKQKKKSMRINVIPILDAVFIFIFFLLMSAQFVDVYEIETEVPKISSSSEASKDKPLNLMLKIGQEEIVMTTGIEEQIVEKVERINGLYNLEKLNLALIKIKSAHFNESTIVLKPEKTIAYNEIISIIDNIKKSHFGAIKDPRLGKEGSATDILFDQIIFETII